MQTKSEAQFEQQRFVKVMIQEVIKELGGDDGFRESKTYHELVTSPTKYYHNSPQDIVDLYEIEQKGERNED